MSDMAIFRQSTSPSASIYEMTEPTKHLAMQTPPSDRPARRSPASWAIVIVVVLAVALLNIWYDYHHPLGIVFDVALTLVVLVRYVSKSE
jgi:hypothetical protein